MLVKAGALTAKNLWLAPGLESSLLGVKHSAQRPLHSPSCKLLRQSNLVMQMLLWLSPLAWSCYQHATLSIPWAGQAEVFHRILPTWQKKQKEISNVCVCPFFQSAQTRCIKTAQKMWASLYGGFVWRLASSTRHVSDQSWCAGGSHVLTQPSGLSDGEWHHVPSPDLCVRGKMERWEEHKNYDERKQKVRAGRQQDRHSSSPVWWGRKKKKTMMAGRIRGWWRAEGALKGGGIWMVGMDVGCMFG